MKKILSALYRILCDAGIAFLAIVAFFVCFVLKNETSFLNREVLSAFLAFSLIFGISSLLFKVSGLPRFVLILLHFVVNLVNFMFNIVATSQASSAQTFIVAFAFVVVYALITLFVWLITKPFRQKDNLQENQEIL